MTPSHKVHNERKIQMKSLSELLRYTQKALEATDAEMCGSLNITLDTYKAVRDGGRLLPLPARKYYERRVNALLKRCGLEVIQ